MAREEHEEVSVEAGVDEHRPARLLRRRRGSGEVGVGEKYLLVFVSHSNLGFRT